MPTRLIVMARGEDAQEAADACRSLPAYREMLRGYPQPAWRPRWVKTHELPGRQWAVEFEVEERPIILMPS